MFSCIEAWFCAGVYCADARFLSMVQICLDKFDWFCCTYRKFGSRGKFTTWKGRNFACAICNIVHSSCAYFDWHCVELVKDSVRIQLSPWQFHNLNSIWQITERHSSGWWTGRSYWKRDLCSPATNSRVCLRKCKPNWQQWMWTRSTSSESPWLSPLFAMFLMRPIGCAKVQTIFNSSPLCNARLSAI